MDGNPTEHQEGVIPERIGHYRILRKLGEGGMGVVYEAEQESPRRTVALKVIRPGVLTRQVLRRFKHEAQILGWLLHPGIAQIYEAGTADTGEGPQPFFAMEHVTGVPLTEFVVRRKVDVDARLELLAKVCDAVHHAHQKGVIHRDLKPGNILVTEAGQPKILDFGVARTTDSGLLKTTLRTHYGQLVGTLTYMSPEQAHGDPSDLDIRSDVYALGVVAYEILTGSLPYDIENRMIHEVVRTIREAEPTPLRSRSRTLHRDVETIVAMALEKEKSRRYASAAAMAADIRRYLRDEPIAARPPSAMYQIKKFAKRNKTLVGGLATVFLVLVGGIIATGAALSREATQRAQAEIEARRARTVADFTQEMLSAVDPSVAGDLDKALMRLILDNAARRIETELSNEPEIEGTLRDTIGLTYASIGLYAEARPHLDRAVALFTKAYGEDHPYTMVSLGNLSLLLKRKGELEEAEGILRRVLATQQRLLGDEHPDTIKNRINLGSVLQTAGNPDEAQALMRQAVEVCLAARGEKDPVTLTAMNNQALLHLENGEAEIAEPLFRRVLDLEEQVHGPDHPYTIGTLGNLAQTESDLGRDADAEPLQRDALERCRRVFGDDHPNTFMAMNNLACITRRTGKLDESEDLFRETLAAQRSRLGEDHPASIATMNNLAGVLRLRRKHDESEEMFRQSLEKLRKVLGPEHPQTLAAMNNLATILENAGKLAEAEPLQRESVEVLRGILGDEHPTVLALTNNLAFLLQRQDRLDEADATYRHLLELAPSALPKGHWHLGIYQGGHGDCLKKLGRFDEAEERYLESYERFRSALGETNPQTVKAIRRLIELYDAWGKPASATEWRARLPGDAERSDAPSEGGGNL